MPETGILPADMTTSSAVRRRPLEYAGHARLEIGVAPDGKSFIRRQDVRYPFHICKPFRYDGDPPGMATIYLQSCAGGIFDGDSLTQGVVMEEGAAAHVTTQASTIIHETPDHGAVQTTQLVAGAGSFLEYLPDPLILFPRARLVTRLSLDLDPTAIVILSDSFISHDPAGLDRGFDCLFSEARIDLAGSGLVALDRYEVTGQDLARRMIGANNRYAAQGAMMILTGGKPTEDLLPAVQQALAAAPEAYAMASSLPRGIGYWVRILAPDAVVLRRLQQTVWTMARRALVGIEPVPRRK